MTGNKGSQKAPNIHRGRNPSQPGEGGGKGDTRAKSSNPQNWKNEPGNQS